MYPYPEFTQQTDIKTGAAERPWSYEEIIKTQLKGMQALVRAVLVQAILDHVGDARHYGFERALQMPAATWLQSSEQSRFSSQWCCDILGFCHRRLVRAIQLSTPLALPVLEHDE